ncbi:hypothetical protein GCM10010515_71890 [Streptomyces fructofermentans]|uniref:Uncharacterized protein n=1 Tax=Streptomyces fructofermentans TaxID=152141 RepID=A0A918NU47_9ACTN|nr:hypothetical protein GCM10010515_71890 [Streptomyces fructofermentans]
MVVNGEPPLRQGPRGLEVCLRLLLGGTLREPEATLRAYG